MFGYTNYQKKITLCAGLKSYVLAALEVLEVLDFYHGVCCSHSKKHIPIKRKKSESIIQQVDNPITKKKKKENQ